MGAIEKAKKRINADALKDICLEYDLKYRDYPESRYEGFSILCFFLEEIIKVESCGTEEEWHKQLVELRTRNEEQEKAP